MQNKVTKEKIEFLLSKKLPSHFPSKIYIKGNLNILHQPKIAVIGSRHPTWYGREQTHHFVASLAKHPVTILSGGAIGVDCIANETAFRSQGNSCAVLGSGLSRYYPQSNRLLFDEMADSKNGLLISEFEPESAVQKWMFLKRNQTLAALADVILVMEATQKSGSLSTVKAALDLGIEICALPGPVDSLNSSGTNSLIQMGAHCVTSPQEVLEICERLNACKRQMASDKETVSLISQESHHEHTQPAHND